MNLRLILASTAVAVGTTTCSVTPAAADPAHWAPIPQSVRGPVVDGGFVRGACTVTDRAAKCVVRFPAGVRRLEVRYLVGGRDVGTVTSWDRSIAGRPHDRVSRFDRQLAPGVRLDCTGVGAIALCDLELADRLRDFNVSTYSAGAVLDGLRVRGLVW